MLTDHRGNDQGSLSVVLTPCTKKGSPLGDDYFVEDPKELLDKGICLYISAIFLVKSMNSRAKSSDGWVEDLTAYFLSVRKKTPRFLTQVDMGVTLKYFHMML